MTIRAYAARGARSPRSHYDVILIATSFATELATPIFTDVRTYGHLPSFIEIRSGVLEPPVIEMWPFPLLWLLAFSTASTHVQAVIVDFTSEPRIQYNCYNHSTIIRHNF